jgi:flagellar biosynthesis activator protein FlaF
MSYTNNLKKKTPYTNLPPQHLNNPKELEAVALLEAAKRLFECKQFIGKGIKINDRDPVFEALNFNSKLWSIFQVSLFNQNHHMPQANRIPLLEISKFIDRATAQLLIKADLKGIDALIEINRNIAAGLLKKDEEILNTKKETEKHSAPQTDSLKQRNSIESIEISI